MLPKMLWLRRPVVANSTHPHWLQGAPTQIPQWTVNKIEAVEPLVYGQ